MQEHFNQEIENLKINLTKMASVVDDMVERSIQAIETGNIEFAKGIKEKDLEVDAYDNLIQTQCENILALFQPFATDLRFILSSLMINNQLERCGDIAVNISQRIKKTYEYKNLIDESQITDMARKAKEMLKKSIDAFILKNRELADEVLKSDEEVDKLNKKVFKYLVEKMQKEPNLIEPSAHLLILSRHIERLADHATNISENIVFYIDAKLVSHYKKLKKIQE
ncbi:MAG: phosphate signaling complex protein PhoU [Stygiobacter sp.]|jgi:phosphate transport system protein|uniref:Phosphate-specific transport system accessory protein PhoU n=1 Tax=Stygiobacter electus TaxID=3032292 RepID=A0AAE3NXS2_9BACT|nr:phosphate signaling complex protein PhoU [Stygiobacter electus]MDF1612911.1 phosphate signaling complex protein PhoU [Stygiobacter electus]